MKRFICLFLVLAIRIYSQQLDSKYPDLIHKAYYSEVNPGFDSFYGGIGKRYPMPVNPNKLLNDNQDWFVSLPRDSYIIFAYTDNGIINAPHQHDIHIAENGCCQLARKKNNPEKALVFVSHDGKRFQLLGAVDDCGPATLDLEDIQFKKVVRYIKIVGTDYKCNPAGFDLINVYPLTGANVNLYAGIEQAEAYFSNRLEKRTMLLNNIYFAIDSDTITTLGKKDLNLIIYYLNLHPHLKIQLTGHTDNQASNIYNIKLSNRRAEAIKQYLVKNGIAKDRVHADGVGESTPLKSNFTAQGRAYNRRVELRRLN